MSYSVGHLVNNDHFLIDIVPSAFSGSSVVTNAAAVVARRSSSGPHCCGSWLGVARCAWNDGANHLSLGSAPGEQSLEAWKNVTQHVDIDESSGCQPINRQSVITDELMFLLVGHGYVGNVEDGARRTHKAVDIALLGKEDSTDGVEQDVAVAVAGSAE